MKTQHTPQKPATPEEVWRILRENAAEKKKKLKKEKKQMKSWTDE